MNKPLNERTSPERISLASLRPSYPLGNSATIHPKDALLAKLPSSILLSFKSKGKPQIFGGSSLFTLNIAWLPKENGERKYKIPFKKKKQPSSILGHQTTLTTQPFDEFSVNESETYG